MRDYGEKKIENNDSENNDYDDVSEESSLLHDGNLLHSDLSVTLGSRSQHVLSYTEITGRLMYIFLPAAGAFICNAVADAAGSVMLSQIDTAHLNASGIITVTQHLIKSSFATCLFGSGILASQFWERNPPMIGTILQQSWVLALFLSVLSIPPLVFIAPILRSLGQAEEIARITQNYFRAYAWGMPATYLMFANYQVASGTKAPYLNFVCTFLQKIFSTALAYFLMFHFKLDEAGLGYANSIAPWLTFIGSTLFFIINKQFWPFQFFRLKDLKESLSMAWNIIKIGVPIGLKIGNEFLSKLLVIYIAALFGPNTVGGLEIVSQYNYIIAVPSIALSQACGMVVGRSVAMFSVEDLLVFKNAAKIARIGYFVNLAISIVALVPAIFIPDLIISIFLDPNNSVNHEIVSVAVFAFIMFGLMQVIDSIRDIASGLLSGLGDVMFAFVVNFTTLSLVAGIAEYLLGITLGMGVQVVVAVPTICALLATSILFSKWQHEINKRIKSPTAFLPSNEPKLKKSNCCTAMIHCFFRTRKEESNDHASIKVVSEGDTTNSFRRL